MKASLIKKPYFYDAQLKRILVQLLSLFSGYQTRTGTQRNGKTQLRNVPIIYGDMSRVVSYIMAPEGGNVASYVPMMALYMTGLRQRSDIRQAPQHVEKLRYTERARDRDGNLLVGEAGKKITVERFMPVPYELSFKVSIWASNNDEGYQLIEQIATVFNPDMDVQLSHSPADWAFLTSVIFDGEIEMEKAMPSGTDSDPLYVFSLPFITTIWMSPPVKVYESKVIESIHVPIVEIESAFDFDDFVQLDGLVIRTDNDEVIFETTREDSSQITVEQE